MVEEDHTARRVSPDDTASKRAGPTAGHISIPEQHHTIALFLRLLCDFSSINGNFSHAAVAIGLECSSTCWNGRIARMTNTESEFGGQYDSLSDVVTFGVAPALVVFVWGHSVLRDSADSNGVDSAFVFVACAALRLARFNTSGTSDYFSGLPSPAAAGAIVSAVWIAHETSETANVLAVVLMVLLTLIIGILMVSNIRYYSPKGFSIKDRVPLISLVVVVLVIAFIIAGRLWVLFAVSIGYVVSGPTLHLWRKMRTSSGFEFKQVFKTQLTKSTQRIARISA